MGDRSLPLPSPAFKNPWLSPFLPGCCRVEVGTSGASSSRCSCDQEYKEWPKCTSPCHAGACLENWEFKCHPKVGRSQRTWGPWHQCKMNFCIQAGETQAPVRALSNMAQECPSRMALATPGEKACLGRGFPPSPSGQWMGCFWQAALSTCFFRPQTTPSDLREASSAGEGRLRGEVGSGRSDVYLPPSEYQPLGNFW